MLVLALKKIHNFLKHSKNKTKLESFTITIEFMSNIYYIINMYHFFLFQLNINRSFTTEKNKFLIFIPCKKTDLHINKVSQLIYLKGVDYD